MQFDKNNSNSNLSLSISKYSISKELNLTKKGAVQNISWFNDSILNTTREFVSQTARQIEPVKEEELTEPEKKPVEFQIKTVVHLKSLNKFG